MDQIVKRSLLAASVAAALGMMGNAHATNGYELIGIGAYQMGMAGAVVAAPQTAMTAITNPAGIAAVTPATDFSMEAFMPDRHVDFSSMGGKKLNSNANMYGIPAIGWSAPISDGSNIYFGGGMYGTSGMGVDYPYTANGGMQGQSFTGYSNLALWQMAPAVAIKVNHNLSLGIALDIGYMSASFQQDYGSAAAQSPTGSTVFGPYDVNLSRSASAFGLGATLGLLYKINPMWTVGASYTSSQSYKLDYNLSPGDITVPAGSSPTAPAGYQYPAGKYSLTMKTPQMVAVGATVNPIPALTVSGQIKYIDWKDAMNKIDITGPQDFPGYTPKWKDQTVYAIAVNYRVSPALQVRAGYNYGNSPIKGEAIAYNVILPAIVEEHYTVGMDYQVGRHWNLGAAYMYAPKVTKTAAMTTSYTDPNKGQKISLSEQAVSFNIGYKF